MELTAGGKLKRWRKHAKLSIRKAAELSSKSHVAWHQWERMLRFPEPETALEIQRLTEGAVTVEDWAEAIKSRYIGDAA